MHFAHGNGWTITWGDIERLPDKDVLFKFQQASLAHKRLRNMYPGGRTLSFVSVSRTETVEILWDDIDAIGNLYNG